LLGWNPTLKHCGAFSDPRLERWNDLFCWDGPILRGVSSVGRTTIEVSIKEPNRVLLRASLIREGIFPPTKPDADS
jgi:hypothetical protein